MRQKHPARQGNTLKVFLAFEDGYEHTELIAVCSSLDRAKKAADNSIPPNAFGTWARVVEAPVDASMNYDRYGSGKGYKTYTRTKEMKWEKE